MALECNCPPGYQITPDGSGCQKITIGNLSGYPINQVCSLIRQPKYNLNGALFYESTNSRPLPITSAITPDRFLDGINNTLLVTNSSGPTVLWGNGNVNNGRLNNAGVWICDDQNPVQHVNEWIGFTFCLELLQETTYYIGISAENEFRIKLNGQVFVQTTTYSTQFPYQYWHVFPITLQAGTNILSFEGLSRGGATAGFAAEIYNATLAQLLSYVSPVQLAAVTIYSSMSRVSSYFELAEIQGYQCAPGYILSLCPGQDYQCVKIESAPIVCCYQLIDCANPQNIVITNNDVVAPYIGIGAIKVSGTSLDPDTCWTVTQISCNDVDFPGPNPLPGAVITSFTSCETCAPPICYLITDCESVEPTQVISNDLSAYVGQTIKVSSYGDICWQVTLAGSCVGSIGLPGGYTITSFSDCDTCNPTCYILTDCSDTDSHIPITVSNDFEIYLGQTIKIESFGDICWTVSLANNCDNTIGVIVDPVITVFADCLECNPPICYLLTNCTGVEDPIVTTSNLAEIVGKIVNELVIEGGPEIDPILCWLVSISGTCDDAVVITSYNPGIYADCECCIPKVIIPIPPPAKVIPDPVRIFYKIDERECDINDNKRFGEGFYKVVKKLKYGVGTCCEGIHLPQLWLRKQLSDLSKLVDPNYCPEQINACFPNPCNTISTCCQVNKCNTCNPCSTCSASNSMFPCPAPAHVFNGEMCYTKLCVAEFNTEDTISSIFAFTIGGAAINTPVTLSTTSTIDQLQALLTASISISSVNLEIITFDETGICILLQRVNTTAQGEIEGCLIYNEETLCGTMICSELSDCPIPPIPAVTDAWLYEGDGGTSTEAFFLQDDGTFWLL